MSKEQHEVSQRFGTGIGGVLLKWFLIIALMPLLVFGIISHQTSRTAVQDSVEHILYEIADLTTANLRALFDMMLLDLELQSTSETNAQLLQNFIEAFNQSGQSIGEFVKSYAWQEIAVHQTLDLKNFLKLKQYYNIFLIDTKGNVLFAVKQENDLGTNLFKGQSSGTLFAKMCDRTLASGKTSFSDFEFYKPSGNRASGFIADIILNENGQKIGLIAFQFDQKNIDRIVKHPSRLYRTFDAYLIGPDFIMRSNSALDTEDRVLKESVKTPQAELWHKEHVLGSKQAKMGEKAFTYPGRKGYEVIGFHRDLNILGIPLAVISEISTKEAFAFSDKSKNNALTIGISVIIIVLMAAYYLSTLIATPIIRLKKAAEKIGKGELDTTIDIDAENEIGDLASSFKRMAEDLGRSKAEAEKSIKEVQDIKFALDEHCIVAITDGEGTITYANDRFCEISKYSREELLGQNHRIINSGYHSEEFFKNLWETITKGKIWHGEIKNKAKDGTYYWVETSIIPFLNEQGKPYQYISIRTDITVRKETEIRLEKTNIDLERIKAEVEKSSKKLEERVHERSQEIATLYEMSSAFSQAFDLEQLLKVVLESLFKATDYDICAMLLCDHNRANMVIRPSYTQSVQYVDEVKTNLLSAFSKYTNRDVSLLRQNCTVLPVDPHARPSSVRPFKNIKSSFNVPLMVGGDKIGGMINMSSSEENVFGEDEVKFIYTVANQASGAIDRLQSMISEEKSKLESMVESMLEGAIMLDDKGDIVVLNPQARHMMGMEPNEEITSTALHQRMKLVNLDKTLEESSLKNDIVSKEVIMPHNAQQILRCVVSPVKSEDRRVGTAIIFRDITKEKEIDSMKTEFVSMVSHELRTPLSITKEGLSIILDGIAGDITEKQKLILKTSKDNIDRLARLINNLLDISKIEAGKMETRKARVDIVALSKKVIESFHLKAKEKNLDLRLNFSDKEIDIFADQDKMVQVITNLMNNALKFTPSGHIEFSAKVEGDFVVCTVADTGIGISQGDLKKVFTKFQQFGRVAGSGEKGTGLGLTISKGIVEMHDGRIWVESELEKGTKFIFTIPKFTPDLPLKEFVRKGIAESQKNNTPMALITMTVLQEKGSKKSLSAQQRLEHLQEMADILKGNLHRSGDEVFYDNDRCSVVLGDCTKKNAGVISDRLGQMIADYIKSKKLDEEIRLEVGYASYPDDARNSTDLIRLATYA